MSNGATQRTRNFSIAAEGASDFIRGLYSHCCENLTSGTVFINIRWCVVFVYIATRYGPDGPEIESRRGQDFPHPSNRPWVAPSILYIMYREITGHKTVGAWL